MHRRKIRIKKTFKFVMVLATGILMVLSVALPKNVDDLLVYACENLGNCSPIGASVDQGCAANGCPTGTRRVCDCDRIPTGPPLYACSGQGAWSCQCVSDSSCGTTPPGVPPGTPTPPPVTCPGASRPGAVNLQSPADGRTMASNSAILRFSFFGSDYGTGCPTQQDRLFITVVENTSGNCPSTLRNYPLTREWTGRSRYLSPKRYNATGLKWNQWYCWQVTRSNGTASSGTKRRSAVWAFRTPAPPSTPNITGATFVSGSINRCSVGDRVSGRLTGTANDANINNPVQYQLDVSYDSADFSDIDEVRLAFVSDDYLASYPNSGRAVNGDNTLLYSEALEPDLHDPSNLRNLGLRVTNLGGTPTFSIVDSSSAPYFGSGATSGNLTAASSIGIIRSIGSNSTVVSTGTNSYRITFEVEFNSIYQNTDLGVYSSVLATRTSDGTVTSHNPQADKGSYDGNLIYERLDDWSIDMEAPSITITGPNFTGSNRFSVNWNVNDNNLIADLRSYCYFVEDEVDVINDLTSGNSINFNDTVKSYPDPDNCFVTLPGVNNRNYETTSGGFLSDMVFGAYAEDNACNITESTINGVVPKPWFLTLNHTASIAGGVTNVEVPDSNLNLSDIGIDLSNNSYVSTYQFIVGNANVPQPLSRSSNRNFIATNYNNQATTPSDLGFNSWYELAYASASNNATVTNTSLSAINGNLAGEYGVGVDSTHYVRHTGNLDIASGVICNLKAVIFVEGNLTIDPDFTRTNGNACMFIVAGDTTITVGQHKSSGLTSSDRAIYDRVEAMLVTSGTFTTEVDPAPVGEEVSDGLYIKGSVYAQSVNLNRQMGGGQAAAQPSEVFEYDPAHVFHFRSLLIASEFALREY